MTKILCFIQSLPELRSFDVSEVFAHHIFIRIMDIKRENGQHEIKENRLEIHV